MKQTTFVLPPLNLDNPVDFIVSSSNITAYNTITNWPNFWGVRPYENSLIICAPKSSGKTILSNMWAKNTNALFIQKNHEITDNILAHHASFIIDDFNDSWKEKDILCYFNILHENSRFLLITTTRIPNIKLADLSSRINSINRISIEKPDDELLRTFIFKLFSNYSVTISKEVINYLIKVLPREFITIIEIIKSLNYLALREKNKITIPFIKKFFNEAINIYNPG